MSTIHVVYLERIVEDLIKMEQVAQAMIGNSIVRYLELEGFTNHNLPGAPLSEMRTLLRIPAVKFTINWWIPDIIVHKGAVHVCKHKVTAFEKELAKAAEVAMVILCPFYPAGSLRPTQWGIVHRLNNLKIYKLNSAKGEGMPAVTKGVFGRRMGSNELHFKKADGSIQGRNWLMQFQLGIKACHNTFYWNVSFWVQDCWDYHYGLTSSKYVGRGGKFYRRGAAGPDENIVIDNSKAEMKVINCVS